MNNKEKISIVECPRDAMQGWPHQIPTQKKIAYINELLSVGFDTIDFGSFVSAKAIPQMADTREVLRGLKLDKSSSQLLSIIANKRGAEEAILHDEISFLGFPFSISETFQLRNTNSSVASSLETVKEIQELCIKNKKILVVYISMAFGNPYGDFYNEEVALHWVSRMAELDIEIVSVADTVGLASPDQVGSLLSTLIPAHPELQIGAHLHSAREGIEDKINAAIGAGCRRFDGAIKGIGGCPMSGSDLIGNMDTEVMVDLFTKQGFETGVDLKQIRICSSMADGIFAKH